MCAYGSKTVDEKQVVWVKTKWTGDENAVVWIEMGIGCASYV